MDQTQRRYEVIRPLVLFADRTAGQRARETHTHPDTVRKLQRRFQHQGMLSLLPTDVEVVIREWAKRIPDAARQEIDRFCRKVPVLAMSEMSCAGYAAGDDTSAGAIRVGFQRAPCGPDRILTWVRWALASPWRDRPVAARMQARGVSVEPATIQRGGRPDSPRRADAVHRGKRSVWRRWWLDEAARRMNGAWRARSRAVAPPGPTMAVQRPAPRAQEAARRLLTHASRRPGVAETSTMAGREANAAALQRDNDALGTARIIRQGQSVTQMIAQDHRSVTRVPRRRLGVKSCEAAQATRLGMVRMPMRQTGPLVGGARAQGLTPAEPCYALAA